MNVLIFLILIIIVALLLMIYFELEKVLDNTFEIGQFLQKNHKRLYKVMKGKK